MLSLIISGFAFNCHYVVHGGPSTVRLVSRRVPVFPITDIHCMSYLAAVSACFSSITLISCIVIRGHSMLLITRTFHMTNASTEIANGLSSVNGDIFGFEVNTWSGVTQ